MSALPELSDEQIDAVFRNAYVSQLDRQNVCWKNLRAAFPAPRPPRPEWKRDDGTTNVVTVLPVVRCVEVRTTHRHFANDTLLASLYPDEAREMAAALVACADWVDA